MRTLNRFFLASMAVVAASAAFAQITITSNVANGATIRGIQPFRFTVQSKNLITELEFYVGDDLRGTDDSSPYEFSVDAVAEKEGPLQVKVLAYDSEGNRKELALQLTVDNELGKGADYHVGKGQEALTNGNWDEAIVAGRIALKITPKYVPARMLLARANFGKGVFDSAQKFLEDVLAEQPDNAEALDLRAAVALQTAFRATADSREATAAAIGRALRLAAESRSKIYGDRLSAFGKVTDENRLRYVDLAVRAGRYSLVFPELEPLFRSNPRNASVANRLIYTQLRAGRIRQATANAQIYAQRGAPDAAGWGIIAVIRERAGDAEGALQAEQEGLRNDSSDLTLRSAQATLALMRGRVQAFAPLVTELAKEEDNRYEVLNFMAQLANMSGDFNAARDLFQRTALTEPLAYDAYIQRANQLIAYSTQGGVARESAQYDRLLARNLLDAALVAKPESYQALTGLGILNMIEGKTADALRLANTAVAAGPEYAAAHYFLSLVQSVESLRFRRGADEANNRALNFRSTGQAEEAAKETQRARQLEAESNRLQAAADASARTAGQLDVANLGGKGIPDIMGAWRYFAAFGRPILLISPQN